MSSTNRNNTRNANDYYITPHKHIKLFLKHWLANNPDFDIANANILDPSAGGDKLYPVMPYPNALQPLNVNHNIYTMDIREDSSALHKGSYLHALLNWTPDLIITNPPFNLSIEFIKKAISEIDDNGYVIMLQRLNFLGSEIRWDFLKNNIPVEIYVHSQRMGFNPENSKTDSIEYAHFVWRKTNPTGYSKTYLIR